MTQPTCSSSWYTDTGRRQHPGDREVRCDLPADHDGDHAELFEGEVSNEWPRAIAVTQVTNSAWPVPPTVIDERHTWVTRAQHDAAVAASREEGRQQHRRAGWEAAITELRAFNPFFGAAADHLSARLAAMTTEIDAAQTKPAEVDRG
jgi:hypothetical protein